jgi:hypothetical protein
MLLCFHYGLLRGKNGGILVFDLEEDGKNITNHFEKLKPGSSLMIELGYDNPCEGSLFELLGEEDNLLARSQVRLKRESFDYFIRGIIRCSDVSYCEIDIGCIGNNIIKYLFISQDILSRTLDILAANR